MRSVAAVRRPLWIAIATLTVVLLIMCGMSGFELAAGSGSTLALMLLVTVMALHTDPAVIERGRRFAVAADGSLLFMAMGVLGAVGSYVAMRCSGPMTDALLDHLDHLLGFDWIKIRVATERYPALLNGLNWAYSTCFTMPLVVIGMLAMNERTERLYRYLAMHGGALALTVVVAFFFPARAAFSFYGQTILPGNAIHYGRIIAGLRQDAVAVVDLNDLGGIITFPSFHATMAILFMWALWPFRILRIPLFVVNGAMWLAAVPIGGHYVIDVLGGSFIALVVALLFDRRSSVYRVSSDMPISALPA